MWKHFQFNPNSINFSCHSGGCFNEFDIILRSEWDNAVAQGLFTFQINSQIHQRVLDDGDLNYIIELNPNRYEKRRTPYPFNNVNTPYDPNKFNFNKIKDDEILLSLDNENESNQFFIIINNSPIRPYHVLLVPNRQLEQSQILTIDCILFGIKFVVSSADPFIVAGFNSLCGYASVNHLHLHGMYMPDYLYAQTMKCSPFHTKSNCYLLDFSQTEAFGFEIRNINDFDRIAQYVHRITNYLTLRNVAHNMIIVKGESFSDTSIDVIRIFIWFRQSITNGKMFDRCNFACVELAGYMPHQFEDVFKTLTEKELREHLNEIALPSEERQKIKEDVKNLLDN